jgi:hypothetical protein
MKGWEMVANSPYSQAISDWAHAHKSGDTAAIAAAAARLDAMCAHRPRARLHWDIMVVAMVSLVGVIELAAFLAYGCHKLLVQVQ